MGPCVITVLLVTPRLQVHNNQDCKLTINQSVQLSYQDSVQVQANAKKVVDFSFKSQSHRSQ